jgi:Holliday junction resolvasome RuvABC endonuclease subunit
MPDVAGLDLSLTSTGVATADGAITIVPKKIGGEARLVWLREEIHVALGPVDLVVLEGYSFASKFHRAEALGELGGVIRVWLYEHGIPFVVVPPAVLKMYATGKGNAKKDEVLVQAVKASGIEFESGDAADAWWLYAMGMDALGSPVVKLAQDKRRALAKVQWPELVPA